MKKLVIGSEGFLALFSCVCFLFLSFNADAQTIRFLEKKDYEKEDKANMVLVQPSVSTDNARLAITTTKTEFSNDYKKIKMMVTGKVINFEKGRLEINRPALIYMYLGNKLIEADGSSYHDKWVDGQNLMPMVSSAGFFFLDVESQQRSPKISMPNGYMLSYPGPNNQWLLINMAINPDHASALAELVDGKFIIKNKFQISIPQFSPDGKFIYGVLTAKSELVIYQSDNGNLVKTIQLPIGVFDATMLSDNSFLYRQSDPKKPGMISGGVIDMKGTKLKEFSDMGISKNISDDGNQMLTVANDGTIRLIDLASGNVLAEIKDTFIKNDEANSLAFTKGGKSVGIIQNKIQGGKFYLIAYSTGIMSLFSSQERKVVANIFADMDDWAVIASDGRMDGTAGAFEKLEWREYNGEKLVSSFSVGSSFDKYYTPRLLHILLKGEESVTAPTPVIDVAKIPVLVVGKINNQSIQLQGDIPTYNSTTKNIPIEIKVTANKEKITELRLYHNNKLIDTQRGNSQETYQFNVSLNSVFGEFNSIYAIASTADGIDAEKCKIIVNYKGGDQSRPKLHALVIGINQYLNPKYQLNYALPDAKAVRDQLQNSGSTLFESVELKTLFEGEATKAKITKAFQELSTQVKEQDVFLFYYAGHGTMSDVTHEFYIVPQDVTQLYGNDAMLNEKAFSATDLKKMSVSINAQKQVFILDACHSAGALGAAVTRGAAEERAIGQLARSTGTFWLTAAGSDQFATEFEQLGHGVFTYSLLEILQGKDIGSSADGIITIRELSSYIEQRVPELSQQYKGKPQYPSSFSFGNDFPLWIKK
jgi:hypothetical protein